MSNRDYGSKVLGEVTLEQVYGGARGVKALVWEVRYVYNTYCIRANHLHRDLSLMLRRVFDSVARLQVQSFCSINSL